MKHKRFYDKFVIASDVHHRDGIGIEFYLKGKCVLEIFRDDENERRYITFFQKEIELEQLECYIDKFKQEIEWDFCDYDSWKNK